MLNGYRILAFIPARKGSKRVPFKNSKILGDMPLFMHSMVKAKQSKYIDDILVSTDDNTIKRLAEKAGSLKNSLRPIFLSGDHTRIIDVILFEKEKINLTHDIIILLQPTYPFRTAKLIDDAIEKFVDEKALSLISVCPIEDNPVFIRKICNGKLKKIIPSTSDIRSQDFDTYYKIIGNIYINNLKTLSKEQVLNENETPYIIDKKFCLDIDTPEDFEKAQKLLKEFK